MWWSEVAVLLAVTGATLVAIAFLVSLANRGGDVTFAGVLSILSTVVSIGVGRFGMFGSGRGGCVGKPCPVHGLENRRGASHRGFKSHTHRR
ncbi:hypothetical protein GCM10010515_11080 [Streptomyces fructofermentans]|uniref:Uncharacterized protein n=1 Tax=Streptomyces fructofermentans TaxID=152141 RepID=A0A918N737_9ACTN|nr:hypothetical protein GCM10010515_11080 [Streptomyces fructofermentans]